MQKDKNYQFLQQRLENYYDCVYDNFYNYRIDGSQTPQEMVSNFFCPFLMNEDIKTTITTTDKARKVLELINEYSIENQNVDLLGVFQYQVAHGCLQKIGVNVKEFGDNLPKFEVSTVQHLNVKSGEIAAKITLHIDNEQYKIAQDYEYKTLVGAIKSFKGISSVKKAIVNDYNNTKINGFLSSIDIDVSKLKLVVGVSEFEAYILKATVEDVDKANRLLLANTLNKECEMSITGEESSFDIIAKNSHYFDEAVLGALEKEFVDSLSGEVLEEEFNHDNSEF